MKQNMFGGAAEHLKFDLDRYTLHFFFPVKAEIPYLQTVLFRGPSWGPSADISADERTDAYKAVFSIFLLELQISHLRRGPNWGPKHIFFIQTHPG